MSELDGRVRLRFCAAYDKLAEHGRINPEQAASAQELVDRLDEITVDQLRAALSEAFPTWAGTGTECGR